MDGPTYHGFAEVSHVTTYRSVMDDFKVPRYPSKCLAFISTVVSSVSQAKAKTIMDPPNCLIALTLETSREM